MLRRWLLTVPALLLAAAPLAAQRPGAVRPPADTSEEAGRRAPVRVQEPAPDSATRRPAAVAPVVAPDSGGTRAGGPERDSAALRGPAAVREPPVARDTAVAAAAAGEDSVRLHLGLELLGPVFPQIFRAAPGADALWLRPRLEDWTAAWAAAARKRHAARFGALAYGREGADTVVAKASPEADCCKNFLPPPPPRRDTLRGKNLVPGAIADYADLGMQVKGRGEMGAAWQRFYPCDPTALSLCNDSKIPQLKPDVQFGLLVGGTISDRVHVNVDFDQRREFDAANNLNVYYQGFDDEVLQRLEVGDVSIRLPQSRYLTQGIPAGNFGFKATGQLGPMDFQAVFAQQKGDVTKREFKLNGGAGQTAGLVQDASLVLDDGDYVKGQFFFVVNPDSLRGAPQVNALQLRVDDAPPALRPAPGTLVLYRDERISPTSQAQIGQLGYFLADALPPGGTVKHTGSFRRLQPGVDYIAHSSGLWIVLKSPLRPDEALAVGYINQHGDTIGSVNADAQRTGTPMLRLLRGPTSTHQPGQPTWPYEMHQVYRLDASSGVDLSTVALQISLGQLSGGKTFTQASGKQLTYLKLLGLDELPPADQLDGVQIFQPSAVSATGSAASVAGTFLVFPTLQPFETPPPVPSAGLSAAAAADALGSDANHDIYENSDPVARDAAGRFRLNFTYRVKVDGLVSTLNLGALGIREGSEKIYVGDRQLTSGKDYTIDYDIGSVTLLSPQTVFGGNPNADIRATWEQKAMFQLAPTSIFGLNTRYKLGSRGELNLIGLYQAEKGIMARPQLGNEPASIFLGGASGRVDLGGRALDALLAHIPGMHQSATPSALSISGEAALSSPNPNRQGATYVDDFEAGDETPLALDKQSWHLGSKPDDLTGATDVLPAALDQNSAMRLVWQHDWLQDGQIVGPLALENIDKTFHPPGNVSGQQFGENVLTLTLGGDSVLGHNNTPARRWRSLTTVLSTTGRDLSRSEFLELYVEPPAGDPTAALILDLGQVGEDAFYYDSKGRTKGSYPDGTEWGIGTLDEEASLAKHEIWGTVADSAGLWNQECHADRGATYPIGDPRANCTRGNGLIDTEDLNGDGAPELNDGPYFRFKILLGTASPYLVRDETATGPPSKFRLYRIPLRGTGGIPLGGATTATWSSIQHLRITVADSMGTSVKYMRIAHMSIIGSRWAKRDLAGLESGLIGSTPLAGDTAAFQVGPASTLTDANYGSPPGIGDQLQDPTAQFNLGALPAINEKSLRLAVDRLAAGSRAEVYYRYPQQPRSFLNYRQMRLFALARKGSWGGNGNERLLVKLGNDPRNYYLYQSRLNQAYAGAVPQSGAPWLPELTIDFNQWFALRAQAEQQLLTASPGTGPIAVWSRDSSYAIVLEDRARAPNLAAVREISFAVYNGGLGSEPTTEVWIDDLRLSNAMTDPGFAGNLQVDLRAGDFLSASASMASQGAVFHQLNQDASYQRQGDYSLNGMAQLGMLAPGTWDLDAPLTFSWGKTGLAPTFLGGTDVPADQLQGLRVAGSNRLRVGLSLRRKTPAANPLLGLLLDGTSLRLGYTGNGTGTQTSLTQSSGLDGALAYDRRPSAREFGVMPSFVQGAIRALFPRRLEQSELFRRLTTAKLRWTPDAISFSSSYYNQRSDAFRYDQILRSAADTLPAISSFRLGLDNDARISMRPFESLSAELSLSSTRDLLPATRASDQLRVQQAINGARGGIGGLNLGYESDRSLSTQLDWRPTVAAWLKPGVSFSGRYHANRSPSFLAILPLGGDSLATDSTSQMQRQFQADRQLTRSLQIDPNGMVGAIIDAKKLPRLLRGTVKALQPLDLSWTTALGSQFDRVTLAPGGGYQLGLGGLGGWRFMGSDTASVANTRSAFRGRTSITLPFGTELATSYDGTQTDLLDLRGGERRDDNHTWPSFQLTWTAIPLPRRVKSIVTQAAMSAGYQHTKRTSAFGSLGLGLLGGGGDVRGGGGTAGGTVAGSILGQGAGDETAIPVQLSIGFLGSLSASYNGSVSQGTSSDPTGSAQKSSSNQAVTVSGFFKAPRSMRSRFPNPVQATFGVSQQADRQCRVEPVTVDGAITCTPFIDYATRRLNLSLDTELSQLTVGFQMSYNSRNSSVGTLNGSSQFQLGIFGQFNINAGQVPGVGR